MKNLKQLIAIIFAITFSVYQVQAQTNVTALSGAGSNTQGAGNAGTDNTSIGSASGASLGASSQRNTFVGRLSGNSTTSTQTDNTFVGYSAGKVNGTGDTEPSAIYNTYIGSYSGYSSTLGGNNTYVGYKSGYSTTIGLGNTFIGNFAGYSATDDDENTFVGHKAGYYTTTWENTAVGAYSLYTNTTGTANSIFGYESARHNQAGSNNSVFGFMAGNGETTYSYNNNCIFGYQAAYSLRTGSDNSIMGSEAGYYCQNSNYNTYLGWNAGKGTSVYSTDYNTFIGYKSGQVITSGTKNAFLGGHTGYSNSTGDWCTMIGYNAGVNNSTGDLNTLIGYYAGYYNSTGTENTCIGSEAGNGVTGNSYSYSTFVGRQAGYGVTSGASNTYIGHNAGYANTTGAGNTAVGRQSGNSYTTASNTTFIGYGADGKGAYDNCMALGYNAVPLNTGANHLAVGNSSITETWVQVDWTIGSDARIKNNIQENVHGLDFIKLLRPVTYHYDIDVENEILGINQEASNPQNDTISSLESPNNNDWPGKYDIEEIQFSGFIAQEVNEAANQVGYDFSGIDKPEEDGELWGLRYSQFVVPLVKAVQEQQEQIEELKAQIQQCCNAPTVRSLQNETGQQLKHNQNSKQITSNQITSIDLKYSDDIILYQNIPNPFGDETTINFYLPQTVTTAKMVFYNDMGQTIKEIALEHKGNATIKINSSELAGGFYSYSLVVDEKVIDTKRMLKK